MKCRAEEKAIAQMHEFRRSGLSYWKIADVLNAMKVPTKTKRSVWQTRTVQRILQRVDN
ncbi:MAG: hypothetical protein COV44_07380 [Deltaproteobacteria bacterium CG11_big_fil_rev_8_21_14_0_20_45_16]|nr:MAG: hypothetical protein COV44_07380 [Deltaproteobacteria bacterium CG11_big_fil_rev_8_21_14_0_20_45_16]PIS10926.1 MAG: hypothetical protein COT73_06760 [Bdellovibrio sp. CG10_big_fil_rev_8_21_14_0_10_47_8]